MDSALTGEGQHAEFTLAPGGSEGDRIHLSGDWVIESAVALDQQIRALSGRLERAGRAVQLDCSGLNRLDTAGAVLIRQLGEATGSAERCQLVDMRPEHARLMDVVRSCPPAAAIEPDIGPWYLRPLEEVGEFSEGVFWSAVNLVSFVGLVLSRFVQSLLRPGRIRFVPLVHQIDVVGLRSMGIVGMISLLTGAVMVNQGAIQLARFGAEIFVIDMVGILQFRELGVLLTAIIIAGRSGSAFTAQIGSMRLREEVDAMVTLGMDPVDVLVLPRLVALIIALPLLTFYADIVGIFGGAMMAWGQLGISPANFIVYFHDIIVLDHFLVGIIKAPIFAAVIAITGCYQGLTVAGSAESLGANTTRSVVQAIFLVIALDALFALFFTAIDL